MLQTPNAFLHARNERKTVEMDLQLMANRLARLQAEEAKAVKKVLAKEKAKQKLKDAQATADQVKKQQNNYTPMLKPRQKGRRRSNYTPGSFIRVMIIEGKDLPFCMNAHCIVHLDNVFQKKTRAVSSVGCDPKWNTEFKIFDYGHGR